MGPFFLLSLLAAAQAAPVVPAYEHEGVRLGMSFGAFRSVKPSTQCSAPANAGGMTCSEGYVGLLRSNGVSANYAFTTDGILYRIWATSAAADYPGLVAGLTRLWGEPTWALRNVAAWWNPVSTIVVHRMGTGRPSIEYRLEPLASQVEDAQGARGGLPARPAQLDAVRRRPQ